MNQIDFYFSYSVISETNFTANYYSVNNIDARFQYNYFLSNNNVQDFN